ncbi:MAG: metallophosphoesterase [Prevotella sp.]|uniref:metallophosphoesterase n=1 Tax=Prevotella sp. TaxID=59823 RepID=UPI00258FBA44|nr:metallophosphoesterase [Prevotella sp.]MDD6852869.1 metallophosphoesterase [Prevotella sp.]
MNLRKLLLAAALVIISFPGLNAQDREPVCPGTVSVTKPHYPGESTWKSLEGDVTFFMTNDMGRNGYYDQKPIAELMGWMAGTVDPECVLAVGDIHHFNGVASVSDPLWTTNFETIYSHPDLMIGWYPVCGNHEYRGNTQAFLSYGKVSRRWCMPAHYYTKVFSHKNTTVRIIFLDTTPIIDKYRRDTVTYPDAVRQDYKAELDWLDATLSTAHEDWVIVVGHHPIFGQTPKTVDERTDMQNRVLPILRRYHNVDIYACGHIHNFQHLRMPDDEIDYVINSSSSLARPVGKVDGTVFCSPLDGFSVITADKKKLRLSMIDKDGNIIHTVQRVKK